MITVYNGYEEKYLTGAELKKLYSREFIAAGRHHGTVLGITVDVFWRQSRR